MNTPDPAALSNVIGKIYDSAIDPALWPSALKSVSALVDGVFSYIALWNPPRRQIRILAYWSENEELVRSYNAIMPKMPFWDIISQYRMGDLGCNREIWRRTGITESEMLSTEFFKTFATPYGLRDVLVGTVINDGSNVSSVCLHTPSTRDLIGPRDLMIMELLLPHLRRALTIGNLLDMKSIAAAGLASTLDVLKFAVLLVDQNGQILHKNQAATQLLSDRSVISANDNMIATHHAGATNALKAAIERASKNEGKLGYGGIGVPLHARNSGTAAAIAHVLPLAAGSMRPALSLGAVAAIFISRTDEPPQPPLETLIALFDLTPTEARVMVEISKGTNRSETAALLGIAPSTVKTHLSRVFEKTQTSKQYEIARLVARLTPPISTSQA